MSCNNIIPAFLLLLLAGCASTPATAPSSTKPDSTTTRTANEVDKDIAMYALAMADIKTNKLDQAQDLLEKLTAKHPELAGPWANMALIDIKHNELDTARTHLDKAIQRDPKMPQAYNLLGYIDKQQGNINKAIADYKQAIANKPDYALAHYNLALLYDIYLQNIPKAVEHYERYLSLTHNQDTRTVDWVKELKNTMQRGKP